MTCAHCMALFDHDFYVCAACGHPQVFGVTKKRKKVHKKPDGLTKAEREDRRELHDPEGIFAGANAAIPHDFGREDSGYPLGVGMPMGRTMREDGETHREAWMRYLRYDACAYCGAMPEGGEGSVDHIEPKSKPARGIGGKHTWLNYIGACQNCNSKKAAKPLLLYLHAKSPMKIARTERMAA